MSEDVERALARLECAGAVLAPMRNGLGFAVFPKGDRRRRPLARLGLAQVRMLESAGAIVATEQEECFVLSAAGIARVARDAAKPEEAFQAQHRPIINRAVMDSDGAQRLVRGHDADALRKLSHLRDGRGRPWFSAAELAAAAQLRSDWERGQIGLVRGSDLEAPPRGSSARHPGNVAERFEGARCDARRRVAQALESLSPPMRRIVEAVCLADEGLEAVERMLAWPTRSAKLVLKLALAQLAERAPNL